MRKRIFSARNFKVTMIILGGLIICLGFLISYQVVTPGKVLDEYRLEEDIYWPESNNLRVVYKSGLFECQDEIRTSAFESVSAQEFADKHDPNNILVICMETYSIGESDDEYDIYWLETFPGPIPVTMIYSKGYIPEYHHVNKKLWDLDSNRIIDVNFGDGKLILDVHHRRQDSAFVSILCLYFPFGMILWAVLGVCLEYVFISQRRK